MKLSIYQKHVSFNALSWSEIVTEFKGTGTKEDPVIIKPSEDLPRVFYLRNYNIHIHIKNLKKRFISLSFCSNIILKDCQLKYCDILNCSNIKIEALSIGKLIRLNSSRDIHIKDSNIGKIKLNQSNSNTIRNCTIKNITNIMGSDNIFESSTISGKQIDKVEERNSINFMKKWNLDSLVYIIVLYAIVFFLVPNIIGFKVTIQIHFIFLFIAVFVFFITLRSLRKTRNT